MKAIKNPLQQRVKEQAGRLVDYLGTQGIQLSRTQSIEAIARSVHGKPWNTVKTLQAEAQPASRPDGSAAVYLSCQTLDGQRVPVSVVANLEYGSLVMSVNLNAVLQALPDNLVEALVLGDEARWPELYRAIEAHSGGLFNGQTAKATRLSFSTTFGDGLATWLKAFRPHLLWGYVALKAYGGIDQAEKRGTYVAEDSDQPGLWLYKKEGEGCDVSYSSRLQAELALIECLASGHGDYEGAATWAELATVQAASGEAETNPSAIQMQVAGRSDERTGRTLFLTEGPLSANELARITEDGRYAVDVAVALGIWELVGNDLEWLNDEVSERITGSMCDLQDLSFARAEPNSSVPALPAEQIWLRVCAQWSPTD